MQRVALADCIFDVPALKFGFLKASGRTDRPNGGWRNPREELRKGATENKTRQSYNNLA